MLELPSMSLFTAFHMCPGPDPRDQHLFHLAGSSGWRSCFHLFSSSNSCQPQPCPFSPLAPTVLPSIVEPPSYIFSWTLRTEKFWPCCCDLQKTFLHGFPWGDLGFHWQAGNLKQTLEIHPDLLSASKVLESQSPSFFLSPTMKVMGVTLLLWLLDLLCWKMTLM